MIPSFFIDQGGQPLGRVIRGGTCPMGTNGTTGEAVDVLPAGSDRVSFGEPSARAVKPSHTEADR